MVSIPPDKTNHGKIIKIHLQGRDFIDGFYECNNSIKSCLNTKLISIKDLDFLQGQPVNRITEQENIIIKKLLTIQINYY